ncbi:MAG: GNAT family N-acetyltransferase [Candidatus Eisenbacteria bacterium]|jgi:ribosomal protein S18 acetylase RimI-like enzyme|nr:GNAT family N-acetyltransferase [Candidatus Eisenbacteria bacterium]
MEETVVIAPLHMDDVDGVVAVVEATGVFRPCEVGVARELLETVAQDGDASGYFACVARVGGRVAGYACWGPTPCTEGTFDLYWIAVSPALGRRGVAAALLREVELDVVSREGRLLIAETSGTEPYAPARSFYLRTGFREEARIPDFYKPGDAKVVFVKTLWRS